MSFINSVNKQNNKITLYKSDVPKVETVASAETVSVCFMDTETTGTDKNSDSIIEIALKRILVDMSTFEIRDICEEYQSFNDPGEKLTKEINVLTGITDEMIKGHAIDISKVDSVLSASDIIVAHNALFDRGFVDRISGVSKNKIWACTFRDIDWLERGFPSSKQELLCYWHGFYFDSHRAMNDVDALIHLVTHSTYKSDRPLKELIESAGRPLYLIKATNFPYNEQKKNTIKANGYGWNADEKVWSKRVLFDDLEEEREWLTGVIYHDNFNGVVEEINLVDKYKN